MFKYSKLFFVFSLALILLLSCSEDGVTIDDLPPEYANLTVNGMSNADDVMANAGSNATVAGTFTDDVALAYYRVRISNGISQTGPDVWGFDEFFTLSGTSQTVSNDIPVPANTRGGLYNLEVRVTDENVSRSDFAYFSLVIRNDNTPVIDLTLPTALTNYTPGQTIALVGTTTDETDIKTVRVVVERIRDASGEPSDGPVIYAETFFEDGIDDTSWNFNEVSGSFAIDIDGNLADGGTYRIFLYTTDNDDNVAFQSRNVIITV